MGLFFIFFLLYGLAHLFFWWRLQRLFLFRRPFRFALFLLLSFFLFSLLIGGWLSKTEWYRLGDLLSNMGFYWLGFFYILFCMDAILFLLVSVLALLPGRMDHARSWGDPKRRFLATVVAALLGMLYGLYEAGQIGVTRLELTHPEISSPVDSIRIVQVSDVHYGMTMNTYRHHRLLEQLRTLNPDMIVSTGDFLDRGVEHVGDHMDAWQALKPRLGKYAVIGNHEAIIGLPRALALLERAGFRVLRGEWVQFGDFRLLGLDDPRTGESENLHFSPDDWMGQSGVSILLNHRPGWPERLDGRFDLVLSGHTHGGQIFPFGLFVSFVHGNLSGLFSTPWGGWSYISRGTGTWGPPIRILAPPEVTLLVMGSGKEKSLKHRGKMKDDSY